jgi:hypothetical protein
MLSVIKLNVILVNFSAAGHVNLNKVETKVFVLIVNADIHVILREY